MSDPSRAEQSQAISLTGTTVGRFLIEERIGVGGMGEVYRAHDTKLNRLVAIKRMSDSMRSDPLHRRRFLKEAERASQLNHPQIASLYDIIEEQGEIFLVMELVDGVNFRTRFTQETPLKDFLDIALQTARGLRAAHAHHIIHCDIKPENILISSSGQIKVLDFGLARQLSQLGTGSAAFTSASVGMSGTPGYMAPEVMLEETPDARSDIFSLGVVFYEALSGTNPFRKRTVFETADSVLRSEPPPLTSYGVPPALSDIVERMMAKKPAERFDDAEELITALEEFAHTSQANLVLSKNEDRTSSISFTSAWRRVRRYRVPVVTVVLIIALSLGIFTAVRKSRSLPRILGLSKPRQVAVLPFQNVGGQTSDQAFADGLSDVITSELGQLGDHYLLQIVPATEVRTEHVTTAKAALQQFGVDLVVEGTLQPVGNMLRATYSIMDARAGRQIKAGMVFVASDNPFGLQDELAASIVKDLGLDISPDERKRAGDHGTINSAAYDEYLQGIGYLQDYQKKENLDLAIAAFNRALKFDSAYALAYAGLGDAHWHKFDALGVSSEISDAELACKRALAIDENLVEGRRCLGQVYTSKGEYAESVKQLEQAVHTRPTDDESVRALGWAYEKFNRFGDAEATFRRAIDLRPNYWAGYNWLGSFYTRRGQYQKALEMFNRVVTIAPGNYRGYNNAGAIHILQGDFAKAIDEFEHCAQLKPGFAVYSNLGTAYFFQRRFADAANAYSQALQENGTDYVTWGNLGDAEYFDPTHRASSAASYRKAIELAQAALKVNDKDAGALGSIGMYYAMLGKRDEAEAYLRRALDLKPSGPDVWWQASVVYSQLSRTDETLAALQSGLAAGLSSAYVTSAAYFDNLHADPRFQQLIQSAEKLEQH